MYLKLQYSLLVFFLCWTKVVQAQISEQYQTPESVTEAFLDFISFEKGEIKNWDDCRNLFLPTAQFLSINKKAPVNRQIRVQNLEEFVRYGGPQYSKNGFEEKTIGISVNQFNDIATVFQSFHCKTPDGSYEAQGINSYQLVHMNERWWISNLMFTNETEENPLTKEFLFDK